jgi:hypothetical protein
MNIQDIFESSAGVCYPRPGDFSCLSPDNIDDYTKEIIERCCYFADLYCALGAPGNRDMLPSDFIKENLK